jgi:hypothetical protein
VPQHASAAPDQGQEQPGGTEQSGPVAPRRTDMAAASAALGAKGSVLLGDSDGTFVRAQNYSVGSSAGSVAVGDLNSDGRPDLVVDDSKDIQIRVLLGNGNDAFRPPIGYTPSGFPLVGLFNGDNRPDLAVIGSNTVSILLNDSSN